MKIGVCVHFSHIETLEDKFIVLREQGFDNCQLISWSPAVWTDENAQIINELTAKHGVTISAFWCGWEGPCTWNFYEGQQNLGLVPPEYREMRIKNLCDGADFAKKLGVENVVTHMGFIPENPNDPDYTGTIAALKHICASIKPRGQYFLFETGQETPITVVRAIHDIGTGNVGINFDTANVILYGKSSAVDSVKIFGKYVRNLHLKDGNFPTDPYNLGKETPLGEGSVNVPEVLKLLKECGYTGPYIMEREISGEKQIEDITKGRELVLSILKELDK